MNRPFFQACFRTMPAIFAVVALAAFGMAPAWAHKASDSYLSLTVQENRVDGQWDIALRDLEVAIGLDADGNSELTWSEIQSQHAAIAAYAISRLSLKSRGQACHLVPGEQLIDHHTDGAYTVLRFTATCPAAGAAVIDDLDVGYRLLFDVDPQHRGLLNLNRQGTTVAAIFSPERPQQLFTRQASGALDQFMDYTRHGVWHIWIGFDHILFLLSLLLPAVLLFSAQESSKWRASEDFGAAVRDVLKIVTAFTLAHSITLTLAGLDIVRLPSRWVESAIAASVVIAAINNVLPFFQGKRWVAAFIFGLIHGFGFASVLGELGLPQGALVVALIGFNIGVELGQLAIVAAFLPAAYMMRRTWIYRRVVFTGGSVAIALLAAVWLVERAFDMKILTSKLLA